MRAVKDFRVVPSRIASPAALLVVGLEVVGGGLMVAGAQVRAASLMVSGLLAIFNAALIVNLRRGRRRLDCHCYGRGAVRIGWGHVVQNAILLAIAALIAAAPVRPNPPGAPLIVLAGSSTAILFLAAQEMALVRGAMIRSLSRIEVD